MRRKITSTLTMLFTAIALAWASAPNTSAQQRNVQSNLGRDGASRNAAMTRTQAYLVKEVRHELVTLPYYNLFDWLEYDVRPDNTVVLRGQVVRPTTKSDAAARVKDIEGVSRVVNEIEVLPLSPNDDNLRAALYRAIYSFDSPLFRYATQVVPPIHIIVRNGRATLKGIVDSEADKQLAYTRASSVPGVFEVTNELQVARNQGR